MAIKDPYRNADGTLTVPIATDVDGIVFHSMITIDDKHRLYDEWDTYIQRREARTARKRP